MPRFREATYQLEGSGAAGHEAGQGELQAWEITSLESYQTLKFSVSCIERLRNTDASCSPYKNAHSN